MAPMSDPPEAAALREALQRLTDRLDAGEVLPAELAQAALAFGARAYAAAVAQGNPTVPALPPEVTPTEVVVTVSAMLRAAGLNSFDLAMWFHRG